jgi:hypothetical protein
MSSDKVPFRGLRQLYECRRQPFALLLCLFLWLSEFQRLTYHLLDNLVFGLLNGTRETLPTV